MADYLQTNRHLLEVAEEGIIDFFVSYCSSWNALCFLASQTEFDRAEGNVKRLLVRNEPTKKLNSKLNVKTAYLKEEIKKLRQEQRSRIA
jgi:hypothetical protein